MRFALLCVVVVCGMATDGFAIDYDLGLNSRVEALEAKVKELERRLDQAKTPAPMVRTVSIQEPVRTTNYEKIVTSLDDSCPNGVCSTTSSCGSGDCSSASACSSGNCSSSSGNRVVVTEQFTETYTESGKVKKGLFGGLFKKKNKSRGGGGSCGSGGCG